MKNVQVPPAGADAGKLTEAGAKLLDPAGNLQAGIPLCPPEGGAWGVALLAAYVVKNGGLALDEWLNKEVFHTDDASADTGETIAPDPADVAGFDKYMERYIEGLKIERAAVDHLK